MELAEFMRVFAEQLEEKTEKILSPIYKMQENTEDFGSEIKPFPIQREVVRALKEGFRHKKAIFLVGEMGIGKTFCGIWTAIKLRAKRTLIVCPPHLVGQWRKEILSAYPNKNIAIIPDESLRKLNISNMAVLQAIHREGKADFTIISREAVKTEYPVKSSYYISRQEIKCPNCFKKVSYDLILKGKKAKTFCDKCNSPLFQYTNKDNRSKPSLAKYIQRKMKGFFDLIIFDEAHELKAGDSAQGAVLGKLGGSKAKILCMTGTLMGGKSSDIFYLLYRTSAKDMKQEGLEYNGVTQFVKRFGVEEKIIKVEDEDNKYSIGRKRKNEEPRERPGLSPLVVGKFLIDKSAFVRLSDFAEKLPYFYEHPTGCEMHYHAEEGYKTLLDYKDYLRGASKPAKIMSSAIQALLRYTDTHKEEIICDEDEDGKLIELITAPEIEIPPGETEKEQQILRIAKEAKSERKKVLIFTTQTNKRDIQPRLMSLLEENGIKSAVMYNTVSTTKRDEWIKSKTQKIDALICHPKLVSVGMNLLEYPVIVFFDTGYSTYTLRQAARRSFRINQKREQVDVYYLYTTGTIQEDCLSLMAAKNEISLMAEGEIQEGGLSVLSDAGGSIISQLAKVINGELKTENPLEVFSRLNKLNNKEKGERETIKEVIPIIDIPEKIYIPTIQIHDPAQISLF